MTLSSLSPDWTLVSAGRCSASCGGGTLTKERRCTNILGERLPKERCGGGWETLQLPCNTNKCSGKGRTPL